MMKPICFIFVIASAISIIHAKDYRIMIFGGGPAGLETARKFLTLRETNPEIEISKVTVIEKRKTPTRIQAIRLENRAGFNSIFRFPPDIRDQLFNSEDAPGCFNHVGKVNGDCVVAKVRGNDVIAKTEEGGEEKLDLRVYTGVVKISRLEEILREEVTRLNGEIIYTKESFVQEDGSIYVDGKVIKTEDFDLLVCADGSNSICRQTLFKETQQVIISDETDVHSYTYINVIPAEKVPARVKQLKVKPYRAVSRPIHWPKNGPIHLAFQQNIRTNDKHGCVTLKQGDIYVGTQISAAEWNMYKNFFNRPARDWLGMTDSRPAQYLKRKLSDQLQGCKYGTEEDIENLVYESHLIGVAVKVWRQTEGGYAKSLKTGLPNVLPVVLIGDSAAGVHYFTGSGVNIAFVGVDILVSNFINAFSSKSPTKSLFTSSQEIFVSGYNTQYHSMLKRRIG